MKPKPTNVPAFKTLEEEAAFWMARDPGLDKGTWEPVEASPELRSRFVTKRRRSKAAVREDLEALAKFVVEAAVELQRPPGSGPRLAKSTKTAMAQRIAEAATLAPAPRRTATRR